MTKIKAVIFDMDGVLIDAREWHYAALNQVLELFGYQITRGMHDARYDGLSTRKKLQMLTEEQGLPQYLHNMINRIKQDKTLRIAARECYPNASHQVLIGMLRSLGIKIGLVTNSVKLTTDFMLTYAGLIDLLDVVVTNEDVTVPKPNPEGYFKAMEILQVSPDDTVIVEDSHYGIAAAKATGAYVFEVKGVFDVNLDLFYGLLNGNNK